MRVKKLAATLTIVLSAVAFTALLLAQSHSSNAAGRLLTEQEARELALIALPKGTSSLAHFSLEASPGNTTCISFDGLWENPTGSAHIDFWLVNRRTGEVWRGVDPVCHPVVSAALSVAQKRVREQLGVSADEVKRERKRDCCADVLQ